MMMGSDIEEDTELTLGRRQQRPQDIATAFKEDGWTEEAMSDWRIV